MRCYACCASTGGREDIYCAVRAAMCVLWCACCACFAVMCMLCSLTTTGKADLHLGVARLEKRRKQHEVIILTPHHVPLLIVIKNSLQQANIM